MDVTTIRVRQNLQLGKQSDTSDNSISFSCLNTTLVEEMKRKAGVQEAGFSFEIRYLPSHTAFLIMSQASPL